MDEKILAKKIEKFLCTATGKMAEWLNKLLRKVTDNWWEECVMYNLTDAQRQIAEEKGYTELGQLDTASLLRIADRTWYYLADVAFLRSPERECIREMMRVSNNWAHYNGELPGRDTVIRDLDTIRKFLIQLDGADVRFTELDELINAIEQGDISLSNTAINDPVTIVSQPENNKIHVMDQVFLVGMPDKRGIVLSVTEIDGENKYEVFVDGESRTYYDGQITLVDITPKYRWVDADTFKSYLTSYQINNPSASDLYSLNAARIDFVPYQFRPALKIIKSDAPRILIADSVGVGKTIEAGLIIKELEARSELNNVLIICPKPLVTERKWESEMKRFDEDFIPLTGDDLRHIVDDVDTYGEWPNRYYRVIIPYSILDSRVYGEKYKRGQTSGLIGLDPAPHFGLVIIDEAHHIRKP